MIMFILHGYQGEYDNISFNFPSLVWYSAIHTVSGPAVVKTIAQEIPTGVG